MRSNCLSSVSKSPAHPAVCVLFIAASAVGVGVNVGCYLWYIVAGLVPGLAFTAIMQQCNGLRVLFCGWGLATILVICLMC